MKVVLLPFLERIKLASFRRQKTRNTSATLQNTPCHTVSLIYSALVNDLPIIRISSSNILSSPSPFGQGAIYSPTQDGYNPFKKYPEKTA